MPRLARLDAPGVLHHVMGRGIERKKIFYSDIDRNDFIDRLASLAIDGVLEVYACIRKMGRSCRKCLKYDVKYGKYIICRD